MSTFDALVQDVQQTLQGYGNAQPRAAFLNAPADSDDLQFSVADATGFEQGLAEIDNELVFIASVDYSSNVLSIAPDGRGYYGTTAAAHALNARITMSPTWSRNRIASAVNEAILGCYPALFGVDSEEFDFNPVINTYELPSDTQRILRITTDTIGPSDEQLDIKRYSFNANAPTDKFTSGVTVTLEKGAFPGRSIKVTYQKDLTELSFGDEFTASGLRESARLAVKYAATSSLVAFMDTSRLPVDTAQADEYDPSRSGIGTATKASAQLYQRYLMELETERKRLRKTYPVPISVRTR